MIEVMPFYKTDRATRVVCPGVPWAAATPDGGDEVRWNANAGADEVSRLSRTTDFPAFCRRLSAFSLPHRWARNFARRLVALAAFCLLPSAFCLFATGGLYEVREIKPNIFVWVPEDILDQDGDPEFSRAGTAGFIVTGEGVVLVNTANSPVHARELLYEIRRRTDAPVKYVINTDSQGDHTLGNEVFVDQQASIISTSITQAEMRQYQQALARRMEDDPRLQARMRGIHLTLPNQTFDREMRLHVAGREIKLVNLNPDSSAGDTAVYMPDTKVLFLGDLYENAYIPRIGSRDIRGWTEVLRRVENWDVETYVPGHGAPGEKKELVNFRQFLEWLAAEVETRIQQGKSLDQVKRELVPFEKYPWHASDRAGSAVEAVYQQLSGRRRGGPIKSEPATGGQPSQRPVPQRNERP